MSKQIQVSPKSGITIGTTPIASGVAGRVLFQNGGNVVGQDSALFWDNTNKRLGVGANSNSPSATLQIRTNTTTAHDLLQISNGLYGNNIFRIRDNATSSQGSIGSVFIQARIYSDPAANQTTYAGQLDLGGFGLGTAYGDTINSAVWLNNQGNIGDGAGTSVISVASNVYINLQTTKKYKFEAVTGNFGIGQVGTLGARLDIKAQGALSTDIAFRVRNSADTFNLFQINGIGNVWSNGGGNVASNTAYGQGALNVNTTGSGNTAFGGNASVANVTGFNNVAIGFEALRNNVSGSYNVSIGYNSLKDATGIGYNTAIGHGTGTAISSGYGNTFLGYAAGAGITTGNNNTIIGVNIATLASSTTNNMILADGGGNIAIRKDANHNVLLGKEVALATNATNGFAYFPTCAGVPTGVPEASFTGKAPIVIDSTNNKMYIYTNATWVALN